MYIAASIYLVIAMLFFVLGQNKEKYIPGFTRKEENWMVNLVISLFWPLAILVFIGAYIYSKMGEK